MYISISNPIHQLLNPPFWSKIFKCPHPQIDIIHSHYNHIYIYTFPSPSPFRLAVICPSNYPLTPYTLYASPPPPPPPYSTTHPPKRPTTPHLSPSLLSISPPSTPLSPKTRTCLIVPTSRNCPPPLFSSQDSRIFLCFLLPFCTSPLIKTRRDSALLLYLVSFVSHPGRLVGRCFAVGSKQKVGIVCM